MRTYASALAAYSEQKFDFRPLRAKPTDTDVTVNVRVLQPGAQPVPIDYSMEKTASGWKVYDVMVGGVSLVANYRTEFNNVVRESGIDGLIKNLADQEPQSLAERRREEMIRREGRAHRGVRAGDARQRRPLLEEGRRHLAEGVQIVDLGEVSEMDSALLALSSPGCAMRAHASGRLGFANLPESLRTIARLYGVESLLPVTLNAIEVTRRREALWRAACARRHQPRASTAGRVLRPARPQRRRQDHADQRDRRPRARRRRHRAR